MAPRSSAASARGRRAGGRRGSAARGGARRSRAPRLVHVALWTRDLERLRAFYVAVIGGRAAAKYVNSRTGFESYFVELGGGARLELMTGGNVAPRGDGGASVGYAHVALSVGSRAAVDALVARLAGKGVRVLSAPRTTGDGYYEAVVEDPDGNAVEIVA